MSVIIQHKRGTASQWTSLNPTLEAGEVGWESDTNKFKIGTGSTAWNSLAYATLTPSELTSGYARLAFPNTFSVGGHIINNNATGTIPLIINGFAGQTADLQQWKDSSGSVRLSIDSTGRIMSQSSANLGGFPSGISVLGVQTSATNIVVATIRGANGQTANMQEWQTWNGTTATTVANISSGGNITTTAGLQVGTTATVNGNFTAYGTNTFHANQQLSVAVRNGANYTGNILQYSLNDSTVTGGRTARGLLWAGSTGFENNPTYNLSATNPFLTSSTATFTVSTVQTYNPFAAGQKIIVSGASQAQYNGSWITTAVGGSSGAWTVTIVAPGTTTPFTNGGALTATGTIAVEPAGFFKQPHPGAVGLVIKGAGTSGNATDVFRYINSGGSTQTYITAAGDIVAPAISAIWSITSSAQDVTVNAIRARHSVANYRANLQTWENASTVLAGVNAQGQFFTGGTTPIQGTTTVAINTQTPTGTTDISITTATAHGISVGQTVVIAGITPAGYNGTWVARGGTTGSTLVIGIGSNPGAITVAGTVTQNSQVGITALSANNTPLVVRAAASQAANIMELQSSAGAILGSISSVGNTQLPILGVGGTALSSLGGTLRVMNSGSGAVGVTIRGASGQSVDLLQIQNNTPSTLLKVDQNGFLVVGGSSVISNALISSTAYGTTQVGLAIRGTAGHTANLTEWQTSTPTTVASVSATGGLTVGTEIAGTTQAATGQIRTSSSTGSNYIDTTVSDTAGTGPGITGRRARGTIASPTQVQANDLLFGLFAQGYNNASAFGGNSAALRMIANENFTTTGLGSAILFETATDGTTGRSERMRITGSGTLSIGTTSSLAQLGVVSGAAATIGVLVRGAASQSANLQSWQLSDATETARVRPGGQIGIGSLITGTTFAVNTDTVGGASSIGAVIRGAASQTANLQEWQTNTPTTVASVSPSGAFTASGDISTSAILKSNQSSGDEGGQIDLAKSVTNTTLTTGVSIDVYQNRLRFFETGGTNRGFYIDISTGATSAGTNLVGGGGSFTGGTLTSNLTLVAGNTSVYPITFQTNAGTPTATSGTMDYDGTVFYQTANTTPGRALKTQNYIYVSNSTYSLDFSGSAAAQSILGGTTTGITLAAGTTYEFELLASVQMSFISATTMTLTHNFTSSTVSGSPTVAYTQTIDYGSNTTGFTGAVTMSTVRSVTATGVVVAAAISTGNRFSTYRVRGTIRVTGTGSAKVYPSLTSSVVGDNGVTMQSGLIFKLTPIGNGTVTTVGAWA